MELIDVTFRESVMAQRQFKISKVLETIKRLSCTAIDYIEIGYLKNISYENPLQCYSSEYINSCHSICNAKVKLSVMIQPEDFSPDIYSKEVIQKISLVRMTTKPGNIVLTKDIIEYLKGLDIKTSINLLRGSQFTDKESMNYCRIAEEYGADYFYIADSNGNMLPHEVKSRIATLKQSSDLKIGFHAHNNLGFALVNALEALNAGADILDSSLLGFGKGAGNLKTELFPVARARFSKKKNAEGFYEMFKAAQFFYYQLTHPNPIEELYKFALYGLYDIDLDYDKMLENISRHSGIEDYEHCFKYISEADGDREKILARIEKENSDILKCNF